VKPSNNLGLIEIAIEVDSTIHTLMVEWDVYIFIEIKCNANEKVVKI